MVYYAFVVALVSTNVVGVDAQCVALKDVSNNPVGDGNNWPNQVQIRLDGTARAAWKLDTISTEGTKLLQEEFIDISGLSACGAIDGKWVMTKTNDWKRGMWGRFEAEADAQAECNKHKHCVGITKMKKCNDARFDPCCTDRDKDQWWEPRPGLYCDDMYAADKVVGKAGQSCNNVFNVNGKGKTDIPIDGILNFRSQTYPGSVTKLCDRSATTSTTTTTVLPCWHEDYIQIEDANGDMVWPDGEGQGQGQGDPCTSTTVTTTVSTTTTISTTTATITTTTTVTTTTTTVTTVTTSTSTTFTTTTILPCWHEDYVKVPVWRNGKWVQEWPDGDGQGEPCNSTTTTTTVSTTTTTTSTTTTTMDAAGYKAQAIEMANLKEALDGMSAAELLSKGFTVQELYDGGFAIAEIEAAGDDGAEFQVPESYDAQYSALIASLNPDDKSSPIAAIVGALLAIIVVLAAGFLIGRCNNADDAGDGAFSKCMGAGSSNTGAPINARISSFTVNPSYPQPPSAAAPSQAVAINNPGFVGTGATNAAKHGQQQRTKVRITNPQSPYSEGIYADIEEEIYVCAGGEIQALTAQASSAGVRNPNRMAGSLDDSLAEVIDGVVSMLASVGQPTTRAAVERRLKATLPFSLPREAPGGGERGKKLEDAQRANAELQRKIAELQATRALPSVPTNAGTSTATATVLVPELAYQDANGGVADDDYEWPVNT